MTVLLDYLHTPDVLPHAIDPQVRNFMAQLTLELRGWSDEVVTAIKDLDRRLSVLEAAAAPAARGVRP